MNGGNFISRKIRKKEVAENPVLSLERIKVDHAEPEILSVDECKTVLSLARAKHAEVLPLLVLNLFCGIRPSEVRRLGMANFDFDLNEVELTGGQTQDQKASVCPHGRQLHRLALLGRVEASHRGQCSQVGSVSSGRKGRVGNRGQMAA